MSFLSWTFSWLTSWLAWLGFSGKKGKFLLVGLDFAGKSTLMHKLKYGKMAAVQPTQHATSEEISIENLTFTAIDIGGHKQVRRVWREYFPAIDGKII